MAGELAAVGLEKLGKVIEFVFTRNARDKAVVRTVVADMNGRDVVHARHCNEHCHATYLSVQALRHTINTQLAKEMSTDLAFTLRDLETSCRQYMRAMEMAGLADKHYLRHDGPEMRKFVELLDEFQNSAQRIGDGLSKKYNVIVP